MRTELVQQLRCEPIMVNIEEIKEIVDNVELPVPPSSDDSDSTTTDDEFTCWECGRETNPDNLVRCYWCSDNMCKDRAKCMAYCDICLIDVCRTCSDDHLIRVGAGQLDCHPDDWQCKLCNVRGIKIMLAEKFPQKIVKIIVGLFDEK